MNGFDFSINARDHRKKDIKGKKLHTFKVWKSIGSIEFELDDIKHQIKSPLFILTEHTLLKCIMNTHSTILMGRMNRYQNNIMTWVRPTNNKLIDRAIRYVDYLLQQVGVVKSYEEICKNLFEEIEVLKLDESIVLKTFNRMEKGAKL
jgi:N-acetylmuramic acid 6-phosphate etherase